MADLTRRAFLVSGAAVAGGFGLASRRGAAGTSPAMVGPAPSATVKLVDFDNAGKRVGPVTLPRIQKTDAEWKAMLPPASYRVARHGDTEVPYSGQYDNFYKPGMYRCICCDTALFSSDTKYDAHEGWPSFWEPIAKENVRELIDTGLGMVRQEIRCSRCDAHLGHVFDDGPRPTGLRYCMNSVSLKFIPRPA